MNSRPTSPVLLIFFAIACGGANTSIETGGDERTDEQNAEGAPTSASTSAPTTAPTEATCADAEPIPACDESVVETMSGVDVENQWDSLEGQTVHVLGPLMIHQGMCTEMLCGPENPCCDRCGGRLTFNPISSVILDDSEQRFDCGGDSCSLCCGYAVPAENVRTSGRPGVDGSGQRHLFDAVVCVPSGGGED